MASAATLASAIINQNHPPVMKDDFSLYLTLIKESFPPNQLTSDPNRSLSKIVSGRKRIGGGEIDIFGAEKYFNGSMDSTSAELERGGAKSNLNSGGSVSTCSESSGNSQSRLVKDLHKRFSPNHSKQNIGRGRRKVGFLRVLWCSSCSGENAAAEVDPDDPICKNSVKVDEIFENREGEFLCKNVMGTGRTESFSSGRFGREKAPFFPRSNLGKDLGSQFFVKEEMGSSRMSESSSELFEIETLTVNPGECREESESPTRYSPSEASVVWSVVTANTTTAPSVGKKPSRPQRSSLLLGCASDKAVDATVGFRSTSRV